MFTLKLTERERARMLAYLSQEQRHTQSLLRLYSPREYPGYTGMLQDIATDLANVADKLTKG